MYFRASFRLCLEREKQRYASSSAGGHISRVKSYGKSSTTTLREHLEIEHKVTEEDLQSGTNSSKVKQTKLTFKRKLTNFEPFSTQYEMNRDLVVWAALDIEPFMFTEKPGLRYFFEKNYPSLPLPSRATLSRGALYDVYDAVTGKVKDDLAVLQGGAVCIMMDGWTDRYKRYPYLGLRVGYINSDWEHKVATISLKVLEKHTGENMSAHIREELKAFGLDLPSMFVFTTHDGAANMVKASSLLRSAHFQHCVGHSLHLLIMTDGVNRIPELVELLKRCKAAVIRLDAKCYVVEDKQAKKKDREVMDDLLDKITRVKEVIQADEDILLGYPDSDDDSAVEAENNADSPLREKKHKTLKQSGITRWNSTLTMIESTLCLWNEMNEALKANGDREYCLLEDDRLILSELQQFLRPFQELTDLVSAEQAHLGLIPLIVREVKDASKHVFGESDCMRKLKNAVEQSLPRRIKISEAVKIATLLDPCAKHLLLAGEMTSDECKKLLGDHTKAAVERMEAVKYSNRESSERASNEEVSTSSHAEVAGATGPPASKKMKLLQKFKAQGHVDDKSHQIEAEVNNYVHLQASIFLFHTTFYLQLIFRANKNDILTYSHFLIIESTFSSQTLGYSFGWNLEHATQYDKVYKTVTSCVGL